MYIRLAEQAAWNTWEESDTVSGLCCGLAGKAYGLLNLYKHAGEKAWLVRAQELAQRAALNVSASALQDTSLHVGLDARDESLYYGNVGIAVLAADMARPEEACMPFFEREGWSVHDSHRIRPRDNTPFVSAEQSSSNR
jgi:serine/threonine-protein kinase